jgi:hypothetical protein
MVNTKIRRFLTVPRILALTALLLLVGLSVKHPLSAQTVTQGYGYDQLLQRGEIVQLKKSDPSKVEPVSQSSVDQMYGVVVGANDAPVTLSLDGTKVYVATNGHFDVLVSSQNGPVGTGDYITVSAISGVGMKSDTTEPVIVGRALASFDGKSGVISNTQIKDSSGASRDVAIGRIQVDINVARNPLLKASEPNLPSVLKKASEAIAGKPVNPAKVYISVVIFVITTITSGVLLYGGVRSAIISIGRNPLSKKSIIKGMIQVVIVGITIFLCGVFGVYLLLKL